MDLVSKFQQLVTESRLSHAYLLWGPDREAQKNFAFGLINYIENNAWDEKLKTFQDAILIGYQNKKSTIGIDEVRDLKSFLYQKPIMSKRRCAFISSASLMTPEAQNAILKIVEEPPPAACIIMTSLGTENLLPALSSRLSKIFLSSRDTVVQNPTVHEFLTKPLRRTPIIKELIDKEADLDNFFFGLLAGLRRDLNKNWPVIKEVLDRQRIIKQFNTNKKLQMEAIVEKILA